MAEDVHDNWSINVEIRNGTGKNVESTPPLDEKEPITKRNSTVSNHTISSSSSDSDQEIDEELNRDAEDYKDVVIPFGTIFDTQEHKQEYFLPCVPVRITITERIHQPASHRLNPNLYVINITHGIYKWKIKRRYNHFRELYSHLELYRAKAIVQHPTMATRLDKVPRFPARPDITILTTKKKDKQMRKLQRFLQNVVNCDRFRNNRHTLEFLEVSFLSFVHGLGDKGKEGEVAKRAGGHTFSKGLFGAFKVNIAWHDRWLIAKSSFVAYIDAEKNLIRDVLLLDKGFTVSCDKSVTGIHNGLLISNNSRNLLVKCASGRHAREWMREIVNVMSETGVDFIREHRYNSFAPVRRNSWIKWFVDGEDYFSKVADAITSAKEEIFITDWWLSPELILKRPTEHVDEYRLDMLLKERAENGVRIYVILYKEIEMTLSINSAYSKRTLMQLHPNIKVLRHPDHVASGNATVLWAHHEKIVCVDQTVCFFGGLDLCYGRWDDNTHRLTDFGSATPNFFGKTESAVVGLSALMLNPDAIDSAYHREQLRKLPQGVAKMFIGKDYTNPYVQDVTEVDKPFTDLFNRNLIPRMPWHDIACVAYGNAARDLARHFIQRWNFTKHQKAKVDITIPFLVPKVKLDSKKIPEGFDNFTECDIQILRSASTWSVGENSTENSIYEAYQEHIRNSKYYIYIENQFFITSLPDHYVLNKIGDALVERILLAYNNNETFRVYVVMPLLPCFPGEIGTASATATCFVEFWNLQSSRNIINKLKEGGVEDTSAYINFYGLRNYADLRGKMVSEIVYVHSKLMIVDDNVVIMGSANINDRSMLGSRDSELAVCVQDTSTIHGVMNGKQVKVGQFAAKLRRKLFQEHLGLLDEPYANVIDPISDDFYKNAWVATARNNTTVYEQVFRCLPTQEVKSFVELEQYKKINGLNINDPVQARSMLKNIRGFLVEKPLDFLLHQNLWPAAGTNESLVPTKVFT
ncbi:phospholipase D1-like [Hydractinia symbiolongicarpus]|uniref:phospholipase D1-like n=1 Tax=Hydractinia symbiolongicarpus TaxID=13093 RepID=UPI00254F0926|nr:phospholipase D1-like [Hydractinia symbiolongicarpus]